MGRNIILLKAESLGVEGPEAKEELTKSNTYVQYRSSDQHPLAPPKSTGYLLDAAFFMEVDIF